MYCHLKALLGILLAVSLWGSARAQLYVVDTENGVINEYDTNTGALIHGSLVVGLEKPRGLAFDGQYLYVTKYDSGTVGKYDAKTGNVVNAALATGLIFPYGIAVSGNNLYVTSFDGSGSGRVAKYDATTGALINASFISGVPTPLGLAVSNNRLFVSYGFGAVNVGEYDATSGEAINDLFIKTLPSADSMALSDDYLWVINNVPLPYGGVSKYDRKTGRNVFGYRLPLIKGLDRPDTIALSGDDLYIANRATGTVGKYNAGTGAVINASLVTGVSGTVAGIAVPSASVSTATRLQDEWTSLLDFRNDYLQLVLLFNGRLDIVGWIAGIVALLVFALMLALRPKTSAPMATSVDPAPAETVPVAPVPPPHLQAQPSHGWKMKYAVIGIILFVVIIGGGILAYLTGSSLYNARYDTMRDQVRRSVEAEQAALHPAPPPSLERPATTGVTLPPILVDPDKFGTENNWIASVISQRIAGLAHLAQHPDETASPAIHAQATVKIEDSSVHVDVTGFSSDPVAVDLKPNFAWDPKGYAPLATKLLTGASPDSPKSGDTLPDELTTLLQLTGPILAQEDVALSALLQKHPAWPEAHEQAALLLVAMALRDRAGSYTDFRPMLSRATAHLAMAQALHGSTAPSWAGEIADAGIRALSGREADASARLDALAARPDCPAAAGTWITALRLRARDDWRLATPNTTTPLLLRIAWFQTLNNNLIALAATRKMESVKPPEELTDWGHAAMSNRVQGSVDTGDQYCMDTTKLELSELDDVLQAEGVPVVAIASVGPLLADPLGTDLYVGQPAVFKIIGPDLFKEFARQHFLMDFEQTYLWQKNWLGATDDAEKFKTAISDQFNGMRRLETLCFFTPASYSASIVLKELYKDHKTWYPWEIADGRLPGNEALSEVHPDIDTLHQFYRDGLPFGTAYDLYDRMNTLWIGASFHKNQRPEEIHFNLPTFPYAKDLHALAPGSWEVFALDADKQNLLPAITPWWDYNLRPIFETEKLANQMNDADYLTLLQKRATLQPDAWFVLGKRLRGQGKDDEAADADRKGFDQALDAVGMSNSVQPLVDYYFDHNRAEDAEMVAKKAAETGSERGMLTYGGLLEKLGRFPEAEQLYKNIADGYKDQGALLDLYASHRDAFPEQNKNLLDKAFPKGLQKVAFSDFTGAPQSGSVFTSENSALQAASLQKGDVVVALDGYRVDTEDQYLYIRRMTDDPHMDLIIWRGTRYFEVHASVPGRMFRVSMEDYPLKSQ